MRRQRGLAADPGLRRRGPDRPTKLGELPSVAGRACQGSDRHRIGFRTPFDEAGANFADLDAVVFTRLQAYNTVDFPSLIEGSLKSGRDRVLPVFGPANPDGESTTAFIKRLIGPDGAYGYLSRFLTVDSPAEYRINVRDVMAIGTRRWADFGTENVKLTAIPVHHGGLPALAWRVEIEGISLAFAGGFSNQKGNGRQVRAERPCTCGPPCHFRVGAGQDPGPLFQTVGSRTNRHRRQRAQPDSRPSHHAHAGHGDHSHGEDRGTLLGTVLLRGRVAVLGLVTVCLGEPASPLANPATVRPGGRRRGRACPVPDPTRIRASARAAPTQGSSGMMEFSPWMERGMGKGDIRTRRGKIVRGTYGNKRRRKRKKADDTKKG